MLKKVKEFFFEEIEESVEIEEFPQFEAEPVLVEEPRKENIIPEESTNRVSFINLTEEKEPIEILEVEEEIVEDVFEETKSETSEYESEYEFNPVISPIFGITSQEKNLIEKGFFPKEVKTTKGEESILGTIISPIYGVKKPITETEEVIEVFEHLEEPDFNEEEVLANLKEESFESEIVDDHVEPELIIDESIDDLIEEFYYEVDEDDQFTLFSKELD